MADRTSIKNEALRLLGEPPTVGEGDSSTWVKRIDNAWADVVRSVFEDHDWSFATNTVTLVPETVTPEGWRYAFTLPATSRRLVKVYSSTRSMNQIQHMVRGGLLLTDYEETSVVFVDSSYEALYGSWPQKFADLIGAELAERVYPVTDESNSTAQRIFNVLKDRRRDAKAFDRSLNPPQERPATGFQSARFTNVRGYGRGRHS